MNNQTEPKSGEATIVYPPIQIFEANTNAEQTRKDLPAETPLNKIAISADFPVTGGTYVYHQGDKFPTKGWPFKEAVFATNTVKRAILNLIRFAGSSPARYFLGLFLFLPSFIQRKIMKKAMQEFADYTYIVFTNWNVLIKPNFMCDIGREVSRVGLQMAGLDIPSQRLVKALCMILEYDDAYRYRIQDLMGELNVVDMKKDPAKELSRLLDIAIARDPAGINEQAGTGFKFNVVKNIIPFMVRLPGVKETINTFFQYANVEKMKLDDIDFYRCLLWGDYEFGGISFAKRLEMRIQIDKEWNESIEKKNAEKKTE